MRTSAGRRRSARPTAPEPQRDPPPTGPFGRGDSATRVLQGCGATGGLDVGDHIDVEPGAAEPRRRRGLTVGAGAGLLAAGLVAGLLLGGLGVAGARSGGPSAAPSPGAPGWPRG